MPARHTHINDHENLSTCLITGAASFLGEKVCRQLLEQNCYVYGLDNFSKRNKPFIESLSLEENFEFVESDLEDFSEMGIERPVDFIFHLSSVERLLGSNTCLNPASNLQDFGTKSLLKFAQNSNAKILLGSSEDLHHQFNKAFFSNPSSYQRQNDCIQAKNIAEMLVVESAREYGVDARIVRYGFLLGGGMDLSALNIISYLLRAGLRDKKVLLPNDGMGLIYPTFVEDAALGTIKAMFSQNSKSQVYGLINPQGISLLHFVYLLRDISGQSILDNFFEVDADFGKFKISKDILKTQEALGWFPRTEFHKSLQEVVFWIRQNSQIINQQAGINSDAFIIPNQDIEKNSTLDDEFAEVQLNFSSPIYQAFSKPVEQNPVVMVKPVQKPIVNNYQTIKPSVVHNNFAQRLDLLIPEFVKHPKQLLHKDKKFFFNIYSVISFSFISSLLVFLLAPSVIILWAMKQSYTSLENAYKQLSAQNISGVESALQASKKSLWLADTFNGVVTFQKNILPLPFPDKVKYEIQQSQELITILNDLRGVSQDVFDLVSIVTSQKTGEPKILLETIKISLQKIDTDIASLSQSDSVETSFGKENITFLQKSVKKALQLTEVLPDILAFDSRKQYLLAFQDSSELRATGGFLDGVALMTVEKGKLLDMQFQDIPTLESQVKGEILIPVELEKVLSGKQWLFRDANFNADFSESASHIAWFYQKSTGRSVDGVIGVNTYTLQSLLKVFGPVTLKQSTTPIDDRNLLSQSYLYAEKSGNSLAFRSDPLSIAIGKELYPQVEKLNPALVFSLADSLYQSLESKDLLLWLPAAKSGSTITDYGWGGTLRDIPKQLVGFGQVDTSDFIEVVENNISVNKSNYYIQRQSQQNIKISNTGAVDGELKYQLSHTGNSVSWPAGVYKSHTYVNLPKAASLKSISLVRGTKITPLAKEDVLVTNLKDVDRYAFNVLLNPGEKLTIDVQYQIEGQKNPLSKITYLLYQQKQSGINDLNSTVTISFPKEFSVEKLSQAADITGNQILFSGNIDKDRVIAVSLVK